MDAVGWANGLPSELPIIQAPMAGGPSTPELTAAVSRAGGFGFLAAGYLSAHQLVTSIGRTRELTDAAFGVNIFCPTAPADPAPVQKNAEIIGPQSDRLGVPLGEPRWDDDSFGDKLEIVSTDHVPLVSFTFGCPDPETIEVLHIAGCSVGVTVTSPAEARVAEQAGADLVLAQGTEAGGHQASFLDHAPNIQTLSLLLEEIRESIDVPMVGTGGIMTGTQVAEVLRTGAIAVQLGTAFLCCPEAETSATYRRAILDRSYSETMITRAFSGRYARGLANEFATTYSEEAPDAYPEIHHLTRPLRVAAAKAGDASTPNLWVGQGWKSVTSDPAEVIIRRLATEMEAALAV